MAYVSQASPGPAAQNEYPTPPKPPVPGCLSAAAELAAELAAEFIAELGAVDTVASVRGLLRPSGRGPHDRSRTE